MRVCQERLARVLCATSPTRAIAEPGADWWGGESRLVELGRLFQERQTTAIAEHQRQCVDRILAAGHPHRPLALCQLANTHLSRLYDWRKFSSPTITHQQKRELVSLCDTLSTTEYLRYLDARHLRAENISSTFAKMLKQNSSLLQLELDQNQITDTGCIELISALKVNNTLMKLSLQGNLLTNAVLEKWIELLSLNTSLHTVDLRRNGLDPSYFVRTRINGHASVIDMLF